MKKVSLVVALVLLSMVLHGQSKTVHLKQVLKNLEQIRSAEYYHKITSCAPGDTLALRTFEKYYKEYDNPADVFIGSSFAWFQLSDTARMDHFYDGNARGNLDWNEKTIAIDSFQNSTLPFRPIGPPFFNYTRSIIKYALETKDSISTSLKDFGDSIQFTLRVYGEVVEFFGNDIWYTDAKDLGYPEMISRYDIWIRKSNNLPYRTRREMPHNTSFHVVTKVKLNDHYAESFSPSKYFPPGFSVTTAAAASKKRKKALDDLVGKTAPEWMLKDANDNTVALKDIKHKIVMIQFTGVGCGPCHESIPFLKQLVSDYKNRDFEFVSIETWSKNIEAIKRYQNRNDLNFTFLRSEENVTNSYQVKAVPVFFILDEKRVVRKVLTGYGKEKTDKEIRAAINELL